MTVTAGRWRRPLDVVAAARRPITLAWIAMTLLALAPVWLASVLPMLDVPNHLAQIRGWHSYSDPRYHIADYYDLRIHLVPYMLYHGVVNALMFVTPIAVANKIAISLYVVLMPLSVLALARALHRDAWLALLSFGVVYNQCFIYGFVSYLLAVPLLWFGIAALLRYLDDGHWSSLVAVAACAIGTLLGHVLPWALFGVFAVVLCVTDMQQARRGLRIAAALVPSLLLAVFMFKQEQGTSSFVQQHVVVDGTWRPLATLIREIPIRILDLFPGSFDTMVLVIITASVAALVALRGTEPTDPRRKARRRLLLLLAVGAVVYRVVPFSLEHPVRWWFIAPRLPFLIATLGLLLPGSASQRRRDRLALVPAFIAICALMVFLVHLYRDFASRNRGFFALVRKIERGRSTMVAPAGLWQSSTPGESSGDPATSAPVYWHWPEWPMALRGGYSPYIFDVGFPIVPKSRLSMQAPGFGQWDGFVPEKAPLFDYYLVQHPTAAMIASSCCNVVDAHGSWILFNRIR